MPITPTRRPGSPLPPFERVVAWHGQLVLRFCAAQVGGDRAEDCFQETMLAALRAYDQVRDPDAIRAWLLSIAARKAVDFHRTRARTPVPVEEPDAVLDGAAPAVETVVLRDMVLWEQVRALPRKQREAVTLRYLGDLSHREIAELMRTTEAAARRNVFEAVNRLRKDTHAT
jgi:RNA polymerase sigma factor (sigma-70 family)